MELLRAEGSPPVGQSTEYEPSNQVFFLYIIFYVYNETLNEI